MSSKNTKVDLEDRRLGGKACTPNQHHTLSSYDIGHDLQLNTENHGCN